MTIDPNLSYYKVSIKYQDLNDAGEISNKKANFIVKCSNFADAELLAYYYFQQEVVISSIAGTDGGKDNDYQLVSIQQIQINSILINAQSKLWYRFKVRCSTEDGKKLSEYYYVQDTDLASAAVYLKNNLQQQNVMADLEIMTGLVTNVTDIYQEDTDSVLNAIKQ